MAATTAAISGVKRQFLGTNEVVTRRATCDNAYVTGGEPIPASAFGLTRIKRAHAAVIVAGFAAGFAHADPLVQTDGSLLLRLRAAAGTESASGGDASAVIVDVTVEGY